MLIIQDFPCFSNIPFDITKVHPFPLETRAVIKNRCFSLGASFISPHFQAEHKRHGSQYTDQVNNKIGVRNLTLTAATPQTTPVYQSGVDSWNPSTYNNVSVWCRQLEPFNLQQCISLVSTAGTLQPTTMYQSGVDSWNPSTYNNVSVGCRQLELFNLQPGVYKTLQPTPVYH